jgi:hypothetical protein
MRPSDLGEDIWIILFSLCSFTTLLHIQSTCRTIHHMRQRDTVADGIFSLCLRFPLEERGIIGIVATGAATTTEIRWSSPVAFIDAIIPRLASIETHLLFGHSIPPVHLRLIVMGVSRLGSRFINQWNVEAHQEITFRGPLVSSHARASLISRDFERTFLMRGIILARMDLGIRLSILSGWLSPPWIHSLGGDFEAVNTS